MNKKVMACFIGMVCLLLATTLLSSPLLAADKALPEEALKLIWDYDASVEQAYLGKVKALDQALIENELLCEELDARNAYVAGQQKNFAISDPSYRMSIAGAQQVSESAWKILLDRSIEQTLTKEPGQVGVPYSQHGEEGILLVLENGQWKIAAIYDGMTSTAESFFMGFKAYFQEDNLASMDYSDELFIMDNLGGILYSDRAKSYDDAIKVYWNGRRIAFPDQGPVNEKGRVLIPIRPLASMLANYEFVVSSDQPKLHVSLQQVGNPNQGMHALFIAGESYFLYGNGEAMESVQKDLYAPLEIRNGRMILPVRNVGELFGEVIWNDAEGSVFIQTRDK